MSHHTRHGAFERGRELGHDQRYALNRALGMAVGDVLAIQGPPGTGKTTLLQDFVANRVVEAALAREDPDLIVVASTNNQAVTNVLDTFAEVRHSDVGVLGQRWIEAPEPIGLFIASHSRTEQAEEEGYLTQAQIKHFEEEVDIQVQESLFISNASRWLKEVKTGDSLETALDRIHGVLKEGDQVIRALDRVPEHFARIRTRSHIKSFRSYLSKVDRQVNRFAGVSLEQGVATLKNVRSALAEMDSLIQRKQAECERFAAQNRAVREFEKDCPVWLAKFQRYPFFQRAYQRHKESYFKGVVPNLKEIRQRVRMRTSELDKAVASLHSDAFWQNYAEAAEGFLDRAVRPTLFLLALRYFEGAWLLEMRSTVKAGDTDKRSRNKMERMWRQRAKLTPCLVSTLHTLPRHLTYWDHLRGHELPAFDLLDWLIVDEAGQCAPDIAGASLLLTKRLISVGDEHQIEPVWSISSHIDVGNMASNGLISTQGDIESQAEEFRATGRAASSGNLIQATRGKDSHRTTDSIMLTGHRRCVPDIIRFCNQLCYEGKLNPLRPAKSSSFPAVGFWHVPGVCQRAGGSRRNAIEAAAVADFIQQHGETMMSQCQTQTLATTFAVVTPFRQQAIAIRAALASSIGEDASQITVGTVHSLQGAQRPVVLFSIAYSAHTNTPMFFDGSANMLNVAVSRAQDHLVVIGDLDTLRHGRGPAKELFDHLVAVGAPLNGSLLTSGMRAALATQWGEEPGQELDGRQAHDEQLTQILKRTDLRELLIVSPLLTPDSLRKHGDRLVQKAAAGTRIEILVSRQLNYSGPWSSKFAKACELLVEKGVYVRVVDNLTYGGVFVNRGERWYPGRGSWLGEAQDNPDPRLGPWIEPQSVMLSSDNLDLEHHRCLLGLGLEYHTGEGVVGQTR